MSVLNEALGVLGPAGDSNGRYEPGMAKPRKEQRDLAEAMRRLPGHYADRLSARTLQRITDAAAAGQWENAVNELITALHARAEAVTAAERDDLHALLDALNMPVHVSTTWPFSANKAIVAYRTVRPSKTVSLRNLRDPCGIRGAGAAIVKVG
jgi:hypothetical protein